MLIHNATVITFDSSNRILSDGGVYVRGDEIVDVDESGTLLDRYPEADRWDAQGMLVMPGMICAHTHFYGAFARGMYIPGEAAKDFPEILQKLWWPLDRSLDMGGVQSSAEVCLVDAIRNGTTNPDGSKTRIPALMRDPEEDIAIGLPVELEGRRARAAPPSPGRAGAD